MCAIDCWLTYILSVNVLIWLTSRNYVEYSLRDSNKLSFGLGLKYKNAFKESHVCHT